MIKKQREEGTRNLKRRQLDHLVTPVSRHVINTPWLFDGRLTLIPFEFLEPSSVFAAIICRALFQWNLELVNWKRTSQMSDEIVNEWKLESPSNDLCFLIVWRHFLFSALTMMTATSSLFSHSNYSLWISMLKARTEKNGEGGNFQSPVYSDRPVEHHQQSACTESEWKWSPPIASASNVHTL